MSKTVALVSFTLILPLVPGPALPAPATTVEVASTGQESTSLPDLIPSTSPTGKPFVWRSPATFLKANGDLATDIPTFLQRGLDAGLRADECIPQILKKEAAGTDTGYPADLEDLVSRAQAVIVGTVIASTGGFLHGDEAGRMLEIQVSSRPKPGPGYEADRLFLFYPKGEVRIGLRTACRLSARLPEPPRVGDRILLAPRRAPISETPPIIELLGIGIEFVAAAGGHLEVPENLRHVAELHGNPSFGSLLGEIRAIARRPVQR